jgi:ankyrin repeat protein
LELVQRYGWHQVEDELLGRSRHVLLQVDNYTGLNPISALAYYGRRAEFIRYVTKLSYDEIMDVASSGRYNLLHLCANQDWHDIVGELVTKFTLRPVAKDHANRTLLHWALDYDWPMGESDLQILIGGNINQRDNNGMTPLHLAISKRNITVARWLVAAQADTFSRDNRGFTPAHLAANEGYREGVEFLINLTKHDYGWTREGASLVHLMSLWLDGSIIKRFVESRSASVNAKDQKKCTPLHYAAQTGNVSAVAVLLEKGCQVNAKDLNGQTALHHAIRSGELKLPPILLENGADIDLVDLYGQTCLHLSIRYRHEEFTKWLISWKTDMLFQRDAFGFTPLHRACSNGTASEVLELLRCGADILELDSKFRTPLEHAVIGRNQNTTRFILQYRNTDDYRAREWIRSVNTALRVSIEKGFPEIEAILTEAGAWVADRSMVRIEQLYVPRDIREDRWPLVTATRWDRDYHADSYDPSTGSVRNNAGKQGPGK